MAGLRNRINFGTVCLSHPFSQRGIHKSEMRKFVDRTRIIIGIFAYNSTTGRDRNQISTAKPPFSGSWISRRPLPTPSNETRNQNLKMAASEPEVPKPRFALGLQARNNKLPSVSLTFSWSSNITWTTSRDRDTKLESNMADTKTGSNNISPWRSNRNEIRTYSSSCS